jgi:hypothetical protein
MNRKKFVIKKNKQTNLYGKEMHADCKTPFVEFIVAYLKNNTDKKNGARKSLLLFF